jgi:CPA2 family monovalent cation:H+ antiporter-2
MGADLIIMGEREIALGIIHHLFAWQGRGADAEAG